VSVLTSNGGEWNAASPTGTSPPPSRPNTLFSVPELSWHPAFRHRHSVPVFLPLTTSVIHEGDFCLLVLLLLFLSMVELDGQYTLSVWSMIAIGGHVVPQSAVVRSALPSGSFTLRVRPGGRSVHPQLTVCYVTTGQRCLESTLDHRKSDPSTDSLG